jgi:aminoglycoside 3-N-acetyltransferase
MEGRQLSNFRSVNLFKARNGFISNVEIYKSMLSVKANEADILYIHTALNFGIPNNELSRKNIVEIIYEAILKLNVRTIIFPTYTFSFCNGLPFSLTDSHSKMGLINEYARLLPESYRSIDPLMSNVAIGKDLNFIRDIGKYSIGENSTFDLLHKAKSNLKIKFLFLGPKIGDCFTYMHYIEHNQKIPYRYAKKFTGLIETPTQSYNDTYELFVRFDNVKPNDGSYIYENFLIEKNIAHVSNIGASSIKTLEMNQAYDEYLNFLKISPNFFIKDLFYKDDKINNTKNFQVQDMVAL